MLWSLLRGLELSQQWKNFGTTVFQFVDSPPGNSIVGLMETSSKRTYATCHASQDCCCQSPYTRGRPLLTHASAGDPQTLTGRSGCLFWGSLLLSLGPDAHKVFFMLSKCLWWVWGLILKCDCAPSTTFLQLFLCPWMCGIIFWWVPTFSCRWLFSN